MQTRIGAGWAGTTVRALAVMAAMAMMPLQETQAQDTPIELKVITSSPASLNTNFTLVMAEEDAVLIDVPFLRSDAYRLVADILDTGRTISTIVVTHAHPDHYFSLDVLTEAFPKAEVIAAPTVVDDIWESFPDRLAFWKPMIGLNAPRYPYIPDRHEGGSFTFHGHEIRILGPMQGDTGVSTALHIPDLNAVVAGDLVFNQVHVYTGDHTKAQRQAWLKSLEKLAALEPETVVAGHKKPDLANTPEGLEFTRRYLARFEKAVSEAANAEELIAIMRDAFPNAIDFQGDFILTTSAQNALGE